VEHAVRFLPSGIRIQVPAETSLLEAARRAGLPLASSCDARGICAGCGIEILAGGERLPRETAEEARVKLANRVDPSRRLACRIALRCDLIVRAPYW
jgi:ferredoxin